VNEGIDFEFKSFLFSKSSRNLDGVMLAIDPVPGKIHSFRWFQLTLRGKYDRGKLLFM